VKPLGIFALILVFTFGCSSKPMRPTLPRKPVPPKAKAVSQPRIKSSKLNPQKAAPRPTAPIPERLFKPLKRKKLRPRFYLPTVRNAKDGSVMVRVPRGTYPVSAQRISTQSTASEPKPLPEFFIDAYEITVAQYKQFDDTYDEMVFTGGKPCPECPAMAIDWLSAFKYCQWAGKHLPHEGEWEAAARGTSPQTLPWGEKHSPKTANLWGEEDGFGGVAPVGSFPQGASPFGALDMIGNQWEWVSTPAQNSRDTANEKKSNSYILKGGSWRSAPRHSTIAHRNLAPANMKNPAFGFRCAKPGDMRR